MILICGFSRLLEVLLRRQVDIADRRVAEGETIPWNRATNTAGDKAARAVSGQSHLRPRLALEGISLVVGLAATFRLLNFFVPCSIPEARAPLRHAPNLSVQYLSAFPISGQMHFRPMQLAATALPRKPHPPGRVESPACPVELGNSSDHWVGVLRVTSPPLSHG